MLKQVILDKFNNGEFDNCSAKKIFNNLDIKSGYEKDIIRQILNELVKDGTLIFYDGKFTLTKNTQFMRGTISGNERGFAFFIPDDKTFPDLFLPNRSLNGAYHNDVVLVAKATSAKASDDEGEVVAILERGIKRFVGTFIKERTFAFVSPDNVKFFDDVHVQLKNSLNATNGDKVVCEIIEYPKDKKPEGKVVEIIGKKFDLDVEELSIIKDFGLEESFSRSVMKEAESLEKEVKLENCLDRVDFSNEPIITIDGDDSRDFDDAVSVKKLKNGNYLLGVHIADVSHYVKRNGEIDKEAFLRATSVYFPDRVIPMLPKELSNGICSLNEGVLRLTLSCVMEIDGKGNVVEKKISKGVIKSKHRMTYKKVQAIIEGDNKLIEEYSDIYNMILDMLELQKILSKKRDERGSINLESSESHIVLDDNGNIQISARDSITAYKIIEEFMVITNETIAEFVYYQDLPFIYRVHEKPSTEKLQTFVKFVTNLGLNVNFAKRICYSKDYQLVLEQAFEKPYYSLVNRVMLRSMQKAKYSEENIEHFGLASKCYCHFTSPIRRYPDLVIHRIIKMILDGQVGEIEEEYGEFVKVASENSSLQEKKADDVEREVDDLYKMFYMNDHMGEQFKGVISGVTQNGIYVELENTVEGMVRIEDLPRGEYVFDSDNFSLKSRRNAYKLGDEVIICVVDILYQSKKVLFLCVENLSENSRTKKHKKSK